MPAIQLVGGGVGPSSLECVVESLSGDLIAPGNLGYRDPHVDHRSAGLHVLVGELALIDTLGLRQLDPFPLPFEDPRAFELRHSRQEREEEFLHGGAAVFGDGDALRDEGDRAALPGQRVDERVEISGISAEAIQRGDADMVALSRVVDELVQAGAVGAGFPTELVLEGLICDFRC